MVGKLWTKEEEEAMREYTRKHPVPNWHVLTNLEPLRRHQRSMSSIRNKWRRMLREGFFYFGESKVESETEDELEDKRTFPDQGRDIIASSIVQAELSALESESPAIPINRRDEIRDYLKLFGYYENRTILQVYVPGHFKKRPREEPSPAKERYGAPTFVIVGRSHDRSLPSVVTSPASAKHTTGYVGYISMATNRKPPHELVPIDFTPTHFHYPDEWKTDDDSSGYLIGMHVPGKFAKDKNLLLRQLYRIGKSQKTQENWTFLNWIKELGYKEETGGQGPEEEDQGVWRDKEVSENEVDGESLEIV